MSDGLNHIGSRGDYNRGVSLDTIHKIVGCTIIAAIPVFVILAAAPAAGAGGGLVARFKFNHLPLHSLGIGAGTALATAFVIAALFLIPLAAVTTLGVIAGGAGLIHNKVSHKSEQK